ncbi:unnamed protein product (macronuclear) [Paramecium tetraurelia]|uniref:DNA ligase 1 n=1 Tax=Paramecium tetraurelia TaxID=5888 RepID=A0EA99_PARTE|nr:uncharacterized protein GSPATT00024948001 [Paramecium tetraurelia]CAK92216.1 unnamed protein product [Paramecium tetraurelia]|eukprot:XP_001459613.1 hypothetical protein (macronuclear) [Paramecium tetraurelia strain d4-2]
MQKTIASFFKSSKKGDDSNDQIKEQQFIEENLKKEKLMPEQKVCASKSKSHNMEIKGAVLFIDMAELYEQVGEIKGQNSKDAIKELVAKLFIRIMKENREEFVPAYLFSILKLGPDYESWELGIGQGIIVKSISAVSGKSEKQVRELMNTLGDLGLAIEKSKSTQTSLNKFFVSQSVKEEVKLTMIQVFNTLQQLQKQEGTGSSLEKERILTGLLRMAKPIEAKYIIRFIEKNLKIGAAEKTMQAALARAFQLYHKGNVEGDYESIINQALCECPNYKKIIDTLFSIQSLKEVPELCHIIPGVPCKPMLAKPMKSIQMIFQRFENMKFTCEYKYDGLRGQIHFENGQVSIFSRNLENMTQTYPDIVNYVHTHYQHLDGFIIDSEIVAYDVANNRILPFQTLTSRAKKNVDQNQIEIQVCLYIFDLLYLNKQSYLKETLEKRRQTLRETFKEEEGKLKFATSRDSENFEEIEEFLLNSIKMGCEGLMIKTLEINSQYEPAKRSFNWLKLKKDYLDNGLSDTFDLVPIGACYGTGKRKGFYGSYLLACYNEDMDQYETTCKIGTGFSDENLEKFFQFFQEYLIPHPLSEYKCDGVNMDVWFSPVVVWEIKSADIQISPIYSACSTILQLNNKGVGLRFPRLIKVREDKKPNEATSSQFLYDVYKQQAVVASNNTFEQDDDFY